MKSSKDNKKYPFVYDYWIDKEKKLIYAVVEYKVAKINEKHSNLYLVISKCKGVKK